MRATVMFAILLLATGRDLTGADTDIASAAPPGAGISERLGQHVPGDLSFVDQDGRTLHLSDLYDGRRPILLVPAYYRCPMLCGLVLNAVVAAAKGLDWTPGDQYRVVVISFDPDDRPAEAIRKQQSVLAAAPGDARFTAARWPFLTGAQPAITALLSAIGEQVQRDGENFAHPAIMVVLSGDGVIARYLYGIETSPRDLKFSLMEASAGRTGSFAERILMYCYHYDPALHRYGLFVVGFLRIGGLLALVFAVALVWSLVRRVRRRVTA